MELGRGDTYTGYTEPATNLEKNVMKLRYFFVYNISRNS